MSTISIAADGANRFFAFPFAIFSADELEVRVDGIAVTEGFDVVGEGASDGGHVIFVYPPLSGTTVVLTRKGKVEVSGADQPGFLADKLVAGDNIAITGQTGCCGESLVISAQFNGDDYLRKDQNLADLPDASAARDNLGLGDAATRDIGTGAGQVPTADQIVTLLPSGSVMGYSDFQVFAASGTFTVPAGVTEVFVEVWGAGAGGHGCNSTSSNGIGGASGGYAAKRISGLTPGEVISVTVGAGGSKANGNTYSGSSGGASSFGSHVSATGGQAAAHADYVGTGGNGIGGDLNLTGEPGSGSANTTSYGGNGGAAPRGGCGGKGVYYNGSTYVAAPPAPIPGGGGGGAGWYAQTSGADGARGEVRVYWRV